jgi:hypothetical protein
MKKSVLILCCALLLGACNSVAAGYSRAPDRDVGQNYESVSAPAHDVFVINEQYGQELPTAVDFGAAVEIPAPEETTGYGVTANAKPISPGLTRKIYLLNCSIRQC